MYTYTLMYTLTMFTSYTIYIQIKVNPASYLARRAVILEPEDRKKRGIVQMLGMYSVYFVYCLYTYAYTLILMQNMRIHYVLCIHILYTLYNIHYELDT